MWKSFAMAAVTESWPARSDERVNVEEIPTTGGTSPALAGRGDKPTKANTKGRIKQHLFKPARISTASSSIWSAI